MRIDIENRKSEVVLWIEQNKTKGFIAQQLKCRRDTLEGYLKRWNIVYAGNAGGKGTEKSWCRTTWQEYINTSVAPSASRLRKKLIRDGIKKDECEDCFLFEWRGKKLVLELHHVDGDKYNNKLENLKILCPNCHSLIPNHRKK